jgi:hypothetical protein
MGYIRHQVRREYEKNMEGKKGVGVETQLPFHLHWLCKGFSHSSFAEIGDQIKSEYGKNAEEKTKQLKCFKLALLGFNDSRFVEIGDQIKSEYLLAQKYKKKEINCFFHYSLYFSVHQIL